MFLQTRYLNINIYQKALGVGAPWTGLSPPVKYFYWPFQGGVRVSFFPSQFFPRGKNGPVFCGSFMLFLSSFCYAFVFICLLMPCGHLLGKGWPPDSRLWHLVVKLSLSHWYIGSGVVLDCIDSWFLPSFLCSIYIHKFMLNASVNDDKSWSPTICQA